MAKPSSLKKVDEKFKNSNRCPRGKTWVDDPKVRGGGYCRKLGITGNGVGALASVLGGGVLLAGAGTLSAFQLIESIKRRQSIDRMYKAYEEAKMRRKHYSEDPNNSPYRTIDIDAERL